MNTNDYIKLGIGAAIALVIIVTVVIPMVNSSLDNIVVSADNDTQRFNLTDSGDFRIEIISNENKLVSVNGMTYNGNTKSFRVLTNSILIDYYPSFSGYVCKYIDTDTNTQLTDGDVITLSGNTWTIQGSANATGQYDFILISDEDGKIGEFTSRTFNLTKTNNMIIFQYDTSGMHINKIDYTGQIVTEIVNGTYSGNTLMPSAPNTYTVQSTPLEDNIHTVNVTGITSGVTEEKMTVFAPIAYLEMDKTAPAYAIASIGSLIVAAIILVAIVVNGLVQRY